MKQKISRQLMITNLIILAFALFLFFIWSFSNSDRQIKNQYMESLASEHQIAYKILYSDSKRLKFPSLKNVSSVIQIVGEGEDIFSFVNFPPQGQGQSQGHGIFQIDADLGLALSSLEAGEAPKNIEVSGEKYMVLKSELDDLSQLKIMPNRISKYNQTAKSMYLISYLPYQEIEIVTGGNLLSFALVLVVIIIISVLLLSWQARKLTDPIVKLSNIAKKYAVRDFEERIDIKSNNEIGDLSENIKKMVDNLLAFEKSEIEMFRNLSHDLKTPLTAISGYAEGVSNGYYTELNEPMRIISEEAMRIKSIIEDLILLSKLNSKSEVFVFETCDINAVLISALEKIDSLLLINDVEVVFEPAGECLVKADSNKMLRVFLNILTNSVKYTKDMISIKILIDEEEIKLIFMDNGDGFADVSLQGLFKKANGEKFDGNGIGLLIVGEIVERHGGRLAAYNENGACVEIVLPRLK